MDYNSDEESEIKEVKISDIKEKFIKEEKENNLLKRKKERKQNKKKKRGELLKKYQEEINKEINEDNLKNEYFLVAKKKVRNELVLAYPNEEIRSSLAEIYLSDFYHIEDYFTLGTEMWKALEDDNIENLVKSFNLAISGIPYEDFQKDKSAPSTEGEKKCEYFIR